MLSNKEEKYTIRVIELIKDAYSVGLNVNDMPADDDAYACLGHFDVMRVRKIEYSKINTVFSAIAAESWAKGNEDYYSRCVYPLYVFRENKYSKEEELFWSEKTPFMFVSRVHFESSCENRKSDDALMQIIERIFGKTASKGGVGRIGDLDTEINGYPVYCLFGKTLELGDTTVILKSCCLNACLKIIKGLLENEIVGDIYSYCGLDRELFKENYGGFYKNSQAIAGINTKLPKASMRFSVHSSKVADLFFDKLGLKDNVFFVTGTADALVDISGAPAGVLIRILRILYEKLTEGEAAYTAANAFDDIVTRIGINAAGTDDGAKDPKKVLEEDGKRPNDNEALLVRVREIEDKLRDNAFDWQLAFSSQIRMLLTMKSNCVMDDLSLLIWPSAKAFIDRLYYLVTTEYEGLTEEQLENTRLFLNSWMSLANDIFHLESQLMQNPKLQSPRVYVPAALLAFYMAFLKRLDLMLKQIDIQATQDASKISYEPLIVHDIGLRANTLCVHDPADDWSRDYNESCALLVTLPVSLMFHPERVTVILCHEYLHYSGETGRQREDRLHRIILSCAGIIMNMWHLDERTDLCIPEENLRRIRGRLEYEIEKRIRGSGLNTGMYIQRLQRNLPLVLKGIYMDWGLQSKIIVENIPPETLQTEMVNYLQKFTPVNQYNSCVILENKIYNLLHLYRESYADLAAIICLKLTEETYFRTIIEPEYEIRNKYRSGTDKDAQLNMLCLQAALVCCVEWGPSRKGMETDSPWKMKIAGYIEQIENQKDISSEIPPSVEVFSPQYEYQPLKAYLENCRRILDEELNKGNEIEPLREEFRKMYQLASESDVRPSSFRQDIDWYHKRVFKDIDNIAKGVREGGVKS